MRRTAFVVLWVAAAAWLAACRPPAVPGATAVVTLTAAPAATAAPPPTAVPTAVPAPTATLAPSPAATPTQAPAATPAPLRFAAIGDFGSGNANEGDVARLIDGWDVDFILALGDLNYPDGEAATIDANIGQFYRGYIHPYAGAYGPGAGQNRFWPAPGNHDWRAPGLQPYLDYFTLPGNERYYDFVRGPVHFFAVDSDPQEPDGVSADSVQARWLQAGLAASTSCWNLVYFHAPPYSSGSVHGPTGWMQWPFAAWGADAVLAGHEHLYERLMRDGIVYLVNGLSGYSIYPFGAPLEGSAARFNDDYGALRVEATGTSITYEFVTRSGQVVDTYTASQTCP